MTTKEIIKYLPLEEGLKIQMLNVFDYLEPEVKLDVERLVWNTYHALYKMRIDENLQLQYDEVMKGNGNFDGGFYGKAVQKTEDEMQKEWSDSMSKFDLTAARKALEQIMNEIHAAKDAKKKAKKAN